MQNIINAIIEAQDTNNLRVLESALNAAGLTADLRMRRTTEEHVYIPGYGMVVLDDKHGGWWVRNLDDCDSAIEADDLARELAQLCEYAQAVA